MTATYTTRPAANDPLHGTYFFTTCCGNRMYSVKDKMAYNGALCPRCYSKDCEKVVLFFAGGTDWSDEIGD